MLRNLLKCRIVQWRGKWKSDLVDAIIIPSFITFITLFISVKPADYFCTAVILLTYIHTYTNRTDYNLLYQSFTEVMIGTQTLVGWIVTFGTVGSSPYRLALRPSPLLLVVRNVTTHPSRASVPAPNIRYIIYYVYYDLSCTRLQTPP